MIAIRAVDRRRLEQLSAWRPRWGVVSAYFDIDRGDRSDSWRIELKDGLSSLPEPDDHDGKLAVRETVQRVLERFDSDSEPPPGRAQIGFVEVARDPGTDDWSSMQIAPPAGLIRQGPRPLLLPLIELLDRGRPRPVLAVSAERVRGWIWNQGMLEEEPRWEAELSIYEGHERKAPAMADPARGHATSSSGRDQFGQRLEDNRKRFLRDLAQQVNEDKRLNGTELLAIGEAPYLEEFASGFPKGLDLHLIEGPDVISEKEDEIAERVGPEVEGVLSRHQDELTRSTIDAAMAAEGRGAAGVNEISEALLEGRVEHLLLAFGDEFPLEDFTPPARESVSDGEALGGAEVMVELALRTSAAVTPVTNAAAEVLREHGGVAAVLRY